MSDPHKARRKRSGLVIAGVAFALLLPVPYLIAARGRKPSGGAVVQMRTAITPPAPALVQQPAPTNSAPPVIQEASPFPEQVTPVEMPEVVIDDRREWPRVPGVVLFHAISGAALALEFDGTRTFSRLNLPAGEYQYELRANRYERDGLPDQTGGFRCRKFRRYDIVLVSVEPEFWTPHAELGDP